MALLRWKNSSVSKIFRTKDRDRDFAYVPRSSRYRPRDNIIIMLCSRVRSLRRSPTIHKFFSSISANGMCLSPFRTTSFGEVILKSM